MLRTIRLILLLLILPSLANAGPQPKWEVNYINGVSLIKQWRYEEGISQLERSATQIDGHDLPSAKVYGALGVAYAKLGQYSKAKENFKRQLSIYAKNTRIDEVAILSAQFNMAKLEEFRGNTNQAYASLEKMVTQASSLKSIEAQFLHVEILNELSSMKIGTLRVQSVPDDTKKSLDALQKISSQIDEVDLGQSYSDIAVFLMKTGYLSEGKAIGDRACALLSKHFGPNFIGLAAPLIAVAIGYEQEGKFKLTEATLKTVVSISEGYKGKAIGNRLVNAYGNLGSFYYRRGSNKLARRWLAKAVETGNGVKDTTHSTIYLEMLNSLDSKNL